MQTSKSDTGRPKAISSLSSSSSSSSLSPCSSLVAIRVTPIRPESQHENVLSPPAQPERATCSRGPSPSGFLPASLGLKSQSKIYPTINDNNVRLFPDTNPNLTQLQSAQQQQQQPKNKEPNNSTTYKRRQLSTWDRLLDAIYFVCPDCSFIQCSAIFLGLLLASFLVVALLYFGNYWQRPLTNVNNI